MVSHENNKHGRHRGQRSGEPCAHLHHQCYQTDCLSCQDNLFLYRTHVQRRSHELKAPSLASEHPSAHDRQPVDPLAACYQCTFLPSKLLVLWKYKKAFPFGAIFVCVRMCVCFAIKNPEPNPPSLFSQLHDLPAEESLTEGDLEGKAALSD